MLNSPSLNISGPLTIEAWVKADPAILSNFFNFIVSKQLGGTGYTLLGIGPSNGKVFQFEASTQLRGVGGVPLSTWTHVAGVWDASGSMTLYVNGHPDASVSALAPPTQNAQNLYIGNSVFGDNLRWQGLMDEVRIWNVARSANDIETFMNVALDIPVPGLAARWGFEEGAGSVAHDSSGNHNDGAISVATFTDASDLTLTPLSGITIFPNSGVNSGSVNLELTGSPLLSGAQIELTASGLSAIPGANLFNASPNVLAATFDLKGATPGTRDVLITPQSGATVTLSEAFTITQPAACSYTVAPLNPSFPASGGAGDVVVTSNVNLDECNFHSCGSFPTNASWISAGPECRVIAGPPGNLSQVLNYQVAANPSANSRSTSVSVAGQNVTVSQAGTATCSYNLSPASKIFAASGGALNVTVLAAGGCTWSATSTLSWVHVTAGSPGTGTGFVTIQTDPNTIGLRSGVLTVAGKPFSVSQSADACGATDVSSQVAVSRGAILAGFIGGYYSETVTLRNTGPTSISGPVYLVLDGLPVTRPQCGTFLGQNQTCSVSQASRLTHCQSPSGSDMVLFAPSGLAVGQQVGGSLTFVPGPSGGANPPNWYTTRVFSGIPNQ